MSSKHWGNSSGLEKFTQYRVTYIFIGIFGVVLAGRLLYMQFFLEAKFQALAEQNRLFKQVQRAPRGLLLDRNQEVLVSNRPVYTLLENVNQKLRERILSSEAAMPNIATSPASVRQNYSREYEYGAVLAPLLGYVQNPFTGHDAVMGMAGLEAVWQSRLAGKDGLDVYERNAFGEPTRLIAQQEPIKGEDITLSIDAKLSQEAFAALGNQRGAVIISEPKTGKILAMVSKPSYQPIFESNQENQENRDNQELVAQSIPEALNFPNNPFLFRPVAAAYPPGSIFKIVTALAGLEYGDFDTSTTVVDEGTLQVGEFVYANWYWRQYGRVEGELNLVRALARSNDIFFYKAAEWIGPQDLADFARILGLGKKSGLNFPSEQSGLIPDPIWKQQHFGEKWYLGNTYHMGIGQGDVLTTPLQLHQLISVVAAKGRLCEPELQLNVAPVCQEISLATKSQQAVREGLREACSSGGTAYPFFDSQYEVMCKTGTAEFGGANEQGYRPTHGWFTVALTKQERDPELEALDLLPELVITVLVESDEVNLYKEGSRDAAPVARQIANWWWEND